MSSAQRVLASEPVPMAYSDHFDKDNTHQRDQVPNGNQLQHGNPLSHVPTGNYLPAFGGDFNPGLHAPSRKFANPAPLGLSAFALTTFVLSLINLTALDITKANIVVALAYGYGGLVQLLAGMWEMAVGNTFGATALSSYGGFWIAWAIVLTPSFGIVAAYNAPTGDTPADPYAFNKAFSLFLYGWWIFTTMLTILTLRSTLAFFALFLTLDLAFLMLALHQQYAAHVTASFNLQIAGGTFAILAAFLAWYNAFAGLAEPTNSFFVVPVVHFPWSEKARQKKTEHV